MPSIWKTLVYMATNQNWSNPFVKKTTMLFPATWSLEKSAPEEEVENFLPAATAATWVFYAHSKDHQPGRVRQTFDISFLFPLCMANGLFVRFGSIWNVFFFLLRFAFMYATHGTDQTPNWSHFENSWWFQPTWKKRCQTGSFSPILDPFSNPGT